MNDTDMAYYQRRHAQEVRLTNDARSPAAAAAHHALASVYAEALRRTRPGALRLSVVVAHEALASQATG